MGSLRLGTTDPSPENELIQTLLSYWRKAIHEYLPVSDIVSTPDNPVPNVTFISLRKKITSLLVKALYIASDSTNTQMLLG